MAIRGILLAGGTGSRLYPCNKILNKHVLPVYDRPMIYYPLNTLVNAGIKDILIVSGKGHAGNFLELLGDGRNFNVNLSYSVQEEAGGIAQALKLAENFASNEKIVVILGDNMFEDVLSSSIIESFEKQDSGAKLFLKAVSDANRFGVAEIKNDKIINIEEKPINSKSDLAVTGLYMYDNQVFDIIKTLRPSNRGELEITDVNNFYIKNEIATYEIVKGFWSDMGTFDSLFRASEFVKTKFSEV